MLGMHMKRTIFSGFCILLSCVNAVAADWQVSLRQGGGEDGDEYQFCEASNSDQSAPVHFRFPFGAEYFELVVEPNDKLTPSAMDAFKQGAILLQPQRYQGGQLMEGQWSGGDDGDFHLELEDRSLFLKAAQDAQYMEFMLFNGDWMDAGYKVEFEINGFIASQIEDCLNRNEPQSAKDAVAKKKASETDQQNARENIGVALSMQELSKLCQAETNDFTDDDVEKIDKIYDYFHERAGFPEELVTEARRKTKLQLNTFRTKLRSECPQARLQIDGWLQATYQLIKKQ